jgi:hypothetical protein
MRRKLKLAVGVLALGLPLAAYAAYTQSILNDGTTTWMWQTASGQLQLLSYTNSTSTTNAVVFTVDPTNGPILPAVTTVSALPTCNAAIKGALRTVSDATTPTYNGALTGGSTVVVPVFCNGSAWVSH